MAAGGFRAVGAARPQRSPVLVSAEIGACPIALMQWRIGAETTATQ